MQSLSILGQLLLLAVPVAVFFGARWLAAVAAGVPEAWLPFRRFDVPSQGVPPWARLAVSLAGLVAVYLLASVLFVVAIKVGGQAQFDTTVDVRSGTPADRAGIRSGDRVLRVGGHPVSTFDDVSARVREHGKVDPLEVVVERAAAEVALTVTPAMSVDGQPKIGVMARPPRIVDVGLGTATVRGFAAPMEVLTGFFQVSSGELGGPIGISTAPTVSAAPVVPMANVLFAAAHSSTIIGLLLSPLTLVFALLGWRPPRV